MSHRPVPAGHLAALGEQAARLGAGLVPVTDPTLRQRLVAALTAAAHDQNDTRATKRSAPGRGRRSAGNPRPRTTLPALAAGWSAGTKLPAGRPLIQTP